jgi:CRP/FNR family transcriptional regulator
VAQASNSAVSLSEIRVSCESCSLGELCLPRGLSADEIGQLDAVVTQKRPVPRGASLYRMNDPAPAVFIARSGSFKSYFTTPQGDEQIVGFHLPGELIGLDGLESGRHSCFVEALETSSVCEVPFEKLESLCSALPRLHKEMFRLMGREIGEEQRLLLLLGHKSAEERLASLLSSLADRYARRGLSAREFNLSMPRQDIANYLGLALETVSRGFAHLQESGIITVDRRHIRITDHKRLADICKGCRGNSDHA